MRRWKHVVLTAGGLLLPITPLWAHPSRAIHAHSGDVIPLLVVAAGLTVLLRWRHRLHPPREG